MADAAPAKPAGSTWRNTIRGNVLMMGVVSLLTDFSSEMMNPLLPVFIAGVVPLGQAAVYLGLMEGLAETTASLLKLFSGRLSDALGKRKGLVVVGYGISTLLRPAMALAGAGWQIVALKFGDRVGKGIRTAPRDDLIGDSVGKESRGLAFSFHRAMDHTGAVIGSLAAAVILLAFLPGHELWTGSAENKPGPDEMTALRWLFGIALIPGILAMAALIGKVREIAPKAPSQTPGHAVTKLSTWRQLPRRFYVFVGLVCIFALGNSSDLFLLLYARDKFQLGLLWLIGLWVALHLSKIVFSFPGGIISDKIGRRPLILVGWAMYALVYLGMAQVAQQWQFWALFLAYGFYYGMTEGVEKALVADFVPSETRATAYGIYHGAIGIAALPGNLLFGVLWLELDKLRPGLGPQVAFSVGAGLAGMAALGLLLLLSTAKRQPAQA